MMRTWMAAVALLLVAWIGGLGTAVVLNTFQDTGSAEVSSEPYRPDIPPPPTFVPSCEYALDDYEYAAAIQAQTEGVSQEELNALHTAVIDVCLD